MSPSRTLFLSLVLYLSLVVALVDAYDGPLHQRAHHDYMKRAMIKKRVPQGPPALTSTVPSSPAEPTSTKPTSVSTSTLSTSPQPTSTTSTSALLSSSTSSVSSSSVSQSTSSTLVIETSSPPPQITSKDDGVSTIIEPGVTRTSSVPASQSLVPDKQGNTSTQAKNTTLTVLIAVAASLGGIFILWTIFRKWKLSRSKDFDRRLNPIDWQPTTGDDDQIPGLARRPSRASLHSSGHGHPGLSRTPSSQSHSNPFEDFGPVQHPAPVQVGGYADLARGSSPTQMQERTQYGPGYNHGVTPLPLHHQSGY